ncbi:hypothetical protein FEI17_09250 [Kosakonia radicincitans]|uniref:hypothetical protein n=1 Tax=Kosakonia radicincitans TaxID=283686 RepID=UPI0011F0931C|nr:hypothetical protein [Kosakonia radicincitans]QEM90823.1 hypothetical protein FEI17_09250 [Kosakonia radicincitans]
MNNKEKIVWHRIILTLITFSMILAVLILIKMALSPLEFSEKGWGSRSDLLSSFSTALGTIGTLGTLIIAYLAFRKVPEWMEKKHYDIVYDTIDKAIYIDLNKIKESSFKTKTKILILSRKLKDALEHKNGEPEGFDNEVREMEDFFFEFIRLSHSVIEQSSSITKHGYVITENTRSIIERLNDYREKYYDIYTRFLVSRLQADMYRNAHADVITKAKSDLAHIEEIVLDLSHQIDEMVKKVLSDNKPISDFITANK